MAYAVFSVVFGEQPSAAKWNILGSNDASFNDGSGIANDAITDTKLVNGKIYRRQGGSATVWGTAGTTTYDTSSTDVKLQTGTIALDAAPKAVTFPVAFTYAPQVFAQVVTRTTNIFTPVDTVTTTGFNITGITDGGAANTTQTVNWLAIGV